MESRDAIIVSGWNWEAFNVPERLALALARTGSRILYCENPVSLFRHHARPLTEVGEGIFVLGLKFLGHRLNWLPMFPDIQNRILTNQILVNASKLGLKRPLFIYPHGDHCLILCREFKRRRFPLIHVCMDYELAIQMEHARESDLTLAIPQAAFEELKDHYGAKVHLLPQLSLFDDYDSAANNGRPEPSHLSCIPRPRLGYLGSLEGRVAIPVLREVLIRNPRWHFLSFQANKALPLPNEHALGWRSQDELITILRGLDIGFMPYDCEDPKNLHCVPLKLFDYFARGLPVVSTPIAYLSEYKDLVYLGATAGELSQAITLALQEPLDSPKKAKRRSVAKQHSIGAISQYLKDLLSK